MVGKEETWKNQENNNRKTRKKGPVDSPFKLVVNRSANPSSSSTLSLPPSAPPTTLLWLLLLIYISFTKFSFPSEPLSPRNPNTQVSIRTTSLAEGKKEKKKVQFGTEKFPSSKKVFEVRRDRASSRGKNEALPRQHVATSAHNTYTRARAHHLSTFSLSLSLCTHFSLPPHLFFSLPRAPPFAHFCLSLSSHLNFPCTSSHPLSSSSRSLSWYSGHLFATTWANRKTQLTSAVKSARKFSFFFSPPVWYIFPRAHKSSPFFLFSPPHFALSFSHLSHHHLWP